MTCFDQQHVLEVVICQTSGGLAALALAALGTLLPPGKQIRSSLLEQERPSEVEGSPP